MRQTTLQSSQPGAIPTITDEANPNAIGKAILIELPLETSRLPAERSNTPEEESPEEEIVSIIGPDTPAVVMDSAVDILRIQQVGATTQTSAPPSESIPSPRMPMDNITIPSVKLSVHGYEPISLRSPGLGSPPARPQTTSIIPQLDGPKSLPTIIPTQERMGRLPEQVRQDPSQGGTYV